MNRIPALYYRGYGSQVIGKNEQPQILIPTSSWFEVYNGKSLYLLWQVSILSDALDLTGRNQHVFIGKLESANLPIITFKKFLICFYHVCKYLQGIQLNPVKETFCPIFNFSCYISNSLSKNCLSKLSKGHSSP